MTKPQMMKTSALLFAACALLVGCREDELPPLVDLDAGAVDAAMSPPDARVGGTGGGGAGGTAGGGGSGGMGGNRPDGGTDAAMSGDGGGTTTDAGDGGRADAPGDGGPRPDVGADVVIMIPPPTVPDGLVGYWRLDDKMGVMAADHSGKGNTGKLVDLSPMRAWVDGKVGGGLEVNGGHVVVENDTSLNSIFKEVSMSAWVFRAPGKTRGFVLSRSDDYGIGFNDERLFLTIGAEQKPMPLVLTAGEPTKVGEWVHIAGTFDGKFAKLYANGVEVASIMYTGTIEASDRRLFIGNRQTGILSAPFTGKLDEVRLYNRALTPAEVKTVAGIP